MISYPMTDPHPRSLRERFRLLQHVVVLVAVGSLDAE